MHAIKKTRGPKAALAAYAALYRNPLKSREVTFRLRCGIPRLRSE